MGEIKAAKPVKAFCAILFRDKETLDVSLSLLEKKFGKTDVKSEIFLFNFSDYYCAEMGEGLKKIFVSFEQPVVPDNACEWKIFTNEIERKFSVFPDRPSRRINIDPGYLRLSNVVLLTTKDYSHRIYLGKGIYAEITLIWKQGKFEFLSWTYPDYRTELALNFFENVRRNLKDKIA
ncbi:MAG: DUF4416 family protein [Candidatus Omnitrophica bacterium]|nr:DUF4416 family protein [Candidatus Omnitrophota bacterium]